MSNRQHFNFSTLVTISQRGAFKFPLIIYLTKQMQSNNNLKKNEMEMDLMQFNRYRIPPDFDIVDLHHQAALVYDERSQYGEECPCCMRKVGSIKIPICIATSSFLRISPEIPLYFSYIKIVILVLILFMAALGTQRMFSPSITPVSFQFNPPDTNDNVITIQIGFIQTRRQVRFIFFMIFTLLILFIRGYLKKSKYEVNVISKKLSDRSVMLTNIDKNVKEEDIRKRFRKFQIENIEFTYRVKEYIQNLQAVFRLKKTCMMAKKRRKNNKYIDYISTNIILKNEQIKMKKNRIKSPENRLDFAFMTFKDEQTRDLFLKKYQMNLFARLFYKCCICCSSTAINGQHINVNPGPQAQDIDWLNLQTGYWVKKTHRFACYYMSFAILIFGILLQYQISTFPVESLYISIIKNLVVLVGNFLVVNLLEFTTYEVQKHEMNTNKILSLIKKLTFFVFLNLSMSPFSIYLYYQFSSTQTIKPNDTPFDELCLSILIICIGNISKPLVQYLNLGRLFKRMSFYYQRFLQEDCQMGQLQANNQFQPASFPLASFYSLLLSALFLTAFFLSSFQAIIAVQILSCLILYVISKYMLLRVCKQPIGLNHVISVLCQKMIVLCIPLYWIGQKIMYYICYQQHTTDNTFGQYIYDLLQIYTIIQMAFIVFIYIFSSMILASISKKVMGGNEATDSFIQRVNQNHNKMTYADVNSIKQLEDQLKKYIDSMQ